MKKEHIDEEGFRMIRNLNICMIGFGNAGKEFCRLLINKKAEIKEIYEFNIEVTAIATKSKGSLVNDKGIDLSKALNDVETTGKFDSASDGYVNKPTIDIIMESNADVLIELSALSIYDGQPAIAHIEAAFEKGMHAITANKGPIAWAYNNLSKAAFNKNLVFLYETTVMDGTPVYNLVRDTLPGCKVLSFKGILNSTTNFILEEMEAGKSFDEALKEAQRRGFAEAEPSMDIDGWDAAAKTAALINVLMNGNITPMDIIRKGVSDINIEEINDAKSNNCKIKLLCQGYIKNGKIIGEVHPVRISNIDILSNIDATSSILCITTDLMGEVCIVERNPEIQQTAYGIYSDLLTLIKKIK